MAHGVKASHVACAGSPWGAGRAFQHLMRSTSGNRWVPLQASDEVEVRFPESAVLPGWSVVLT